MIRHHHPSCQANAGEGDGGGGGGRREKEKKRDTWPLHQETDAQSGSASPHSTPHTLAELEMPSQHQNQWSMDSGGNLESPHPTSFN